MGVDVEIYFELISGEAPYLRYGVPKDAGDWYPDGATNRLDMDGMRYYGIGYERGPWPQISADLMVLMSAENVGSVWYFGDNSDPEKMVPFTVDDLLTITRHYVEHGERPYRDPAYRARMRT